MTQGGPAARAQVDVVEPEVGGPATGQGEATARGPIGRREVQEALDVMGRDAGQAPGPGQRLTDHPARERPRRCPKAGPEEDDPAVIGPDDRLRQALRLGFEGLVLVGQQAGLAREAGPDPRIESGFQVRNQLVAHSIAQEGRVGVRGVFPPGEPALGKVREHVGARDPQEGTHDVPRPRPHRRQARGPGAAQQPQEQRLRLVVAGVGQDDGGGAFRASNRPQEHEPLAARRVFEPGLVRPRAAPDVGAAFVERDPEAPREVGAEDDVLAAVGPEAVVEVRGHDAESPASGQGRERIGESQDFRRHPALRLAYGLALSPPFAPCPCQANVYRERQALTS